MDSPISKDAVRFDIEDGDANHISKYVHDKYDFVFSSHCLEHMYDPPEALTEWWGLVKPGGVLTFIAGSDSWRAYIGTDRVRAS